MTYRHTPEMGEISGFGGSYEKTCQDMLENGMKWLVANPDSDVNMREYTMDDVDVDVSIFGIADATGEDGKSLDKAMMDGVEDATGAMHHAVLNRLIWIKHNSWDEYVKELVAYQKSESD